MRGFPCQMDESLYLCPLHKGCECLPAKIPEVLVHSSPSWFKRRHAGYERFVLTADEVLRLVGGREIKKMQHLQRGLLQMMDVLCSRVLGCRDRGMKEERRSELSPPALYGNMVLCFCECGVGLCWIKQSMGLFRFGCSCLPLRQIKAKRSKQL